MLEWLTACSQSLPAPSTLCSVRSGYRNEWPRQSSDVQEESYCMADRSPEPDHPEGLSISGRAKSFQPGTSDTSGKSTPTGMVASMPTDDEKPPSVAGSSWAAAVRSTTKTSSCGLTRKDWAHSTSAELRMSMSGSTTTTHLG